MTIASGLPTWVAGKKLVCGFLAQEGGQERRYAYFTTDKIVDGDWHHFVCVINYGIGMKLYVDAQNKASSDIYPTSGWAALKNTDHVNIGGANGGTYYFGGLIDEVRVYSEALTSAQIQKLYAEGAEKRGLLVKE